MRPLRPPSPRLLFPPFFQSVMPPRRHPLLLPPIPCPPAHHTPLSLILACGRWRCSSRGRKRGGCVAAICICSDRYAREGGGRRRPPPSLSLPGGPHVHLMAQSSPYPLTARVNTGPAHPNNARSPFPFPNKFPFPFFPSPTHPRRRANPSEREAEPRGDQPWRCVPCTTRSGA